MIVRPVKTDKILAGEKTIYQVLDEFLPQPEERSVVVITSKIIALCENRVAPIAETDKEELNKSEADFYLPSRASKYGHHFTIAKHTLAAVSGIDESNGDGNYVLWPKDAQKSANDIREYLVKKYAIKELGIIISDSTCVPMRWGTVGQPLAYSGFEATKNYIGTPDLFGKPFKVSRSGIALGLAAASVVVMGEGTEQTPIAMISDLDFVKFQSYNPARQELENFYISDYKDDLFGPFLESVKWHKGNQR